MYVRDVQTDVWIPEILYVAPPPPPPTPPPLHPSPATLKMARDKNIYVVPPLIQCYVKHTGIIGK